MQQDHVIVTVQEVKESAECSISLSSKCSGDSHKKGFMVLSHLQRFAEKHRRLLNAFVRQNLGLLEKNHFQCC